MSFIHFLSEYSQYRHKIVSNTSPDKKFVVYRTIQTFFFDEEASAPLTDHDELTMVNVQLNVSILPKNYCYPRGLFQKKTTKKVNFYFREFDSRLFEVTVPNHVPLNR